VSIPCGFDVHSLPLGLQIAGAAWGEGNILQVAHAFQQATDWHLKTP
jgi:aspartyl-tRNA(Asn)/glutamyl-tRNA(Gln) amidotransferase subunit A